MRINEEQSRAISDEVDRLLKVGFIRETFYPDGLSNSVLVKKNGKWRVCIDFTNLNEACPKDSFPLLRIKRQWWVVNFLASWIPTPGTTRSRCTHR